MTIYRLSIIVFDIIYFLAHVAGLIVLGFLALCVAALDPKFGGRY